MASYKLIVQNAKLIVKTVANAILNITGIKDLVTGTGNVASNKIDWTLQHYTNTAALFTSTNPILLVGQWGIETDNLATNPQYKIGNGTSLWTALPYANTTSTGNIGLDPVISQLNTPPGSPSSGDRHLVNTVPTGAWVSYANNVAEWNGAAWIFTPPVTDYTVYITSTLTTLRYNGGAWVAWAGTAILQNGNSPTTSLLVGTNNAKDFYLIQNNLSRFLVGANNVSLVELILNTETANTIPYLDASKKLKSATLGTGLTLTSGTLEATATSQSLQDVVTVSPTVDGVLAESLDTTQKYEITDTGLKLKGIPSTTNKLITLNKDGLVSSSSGSGFNIEEDGVIVGYIKTAPGSSFEFLHPLKAFFARIGLNLLTASRTYSLPDISGTLESQTNKDVSDGYVGKTLNKINFVNNAATFTSLLFNKSTAVRNYEFQDRDGVIADDTSLALKAEIASPTFTGTVTTPAIIVSSETASRVAYFDASKNIKSSSITDTTLGYLDATSSIQTQLDGKQSNSVWVDYSATSTIVGWSSFTTKIIRYIVRGKMVHVAYDLAGTSDSASTTFTLANTAGASMATAITAQQSTNNGVSSTIATKVALSASSATVTCTSNWAGGGWTGSGTKRCAGQFSYEID